MSRNKIMFLGENDELRELLKVTSYGEVSQHLDPVWKPTPKALFAMELMMRAMISGRADGEDSQGRAKIREEMPGELVARAVEIADLSFKAFADKGWLYRMTNAEMVTQVAEVGDELEKAR